VLQVVSHAFFGALAGIDAHLGYYSAIVNHSAAPLSQAFKCCGFCYLPAPHAWQVGKALGDAFLIGAVPLVALVLRAVDGVGQKSTPYLAVLPDGAATQPVETVPVAQDDTITEVDLTEE
jgi:ABC-type xylose transport system permease subunit